MPNNEPEIQIMNDRINSLEATIIRGVEASEKVSLSVNDLLLEFRERDVRHEFEKVQNEQLAAKVGELDVTINDYIKNQEPLLARVKRAQDKWDSFYTGMTTTTGKLIIGILILGIMVMLGLDPRTLIKP
jgi:hypothetical protein